MQYALRLGNMSGSQFLAFLSKKISFQQFGHKKYGGSKKPRKYTRSQTFSIF